MAITESPKRVTQQELKVEFIETASELLQDNDLGALAELPFLPIYRSLANETLGEVFRRFIKKPPPDQTNAVTSEVTRNTQYANILKTVIGKCADVIIHERDKIDRERAIYLLGQIPTDIDVAPEEYARIVLYEVSTNNQKGIIPFLFQMAPEKRDSILQAAKEFLDDSEEPLPDIDLGANIHAKWEEFMRTMYKEQQHRLH
jgi:hypothetical protein